MIVRRSTTHTLGAPIIPLEDGHTNLLATSFDYISFPAIIKIGKEGLFLGDTYNGGWYNVAKELYLPERKVEVSGTVITLVQE